MSNSHHHTVNASTNTPIDENQYLAPFLTSTMASKSISTELGGIPTTIKNANTSISSSSLVTPANIANLSNKLNKISSCVNQQDSSLLNQDSTPILEKKPLTVSYYCYYFEKIHFIFYRKILQHLQPIHLVFVVLYFLIKHQLFY
jgi:hypothetical protein